MYTFDFSFEQLKKDGSTVYHRIRKSFKTPKSAYTFARKIEERSTTYGKCEVYPLVFGISALDR